ncbi:hypothetical protein PR202_gb16400 [Eleusine coracana subsp. coracana]|uniref:Uncharacterized protein n=1 Tax=Eleusine coracana subsp. coracana TaxID=191504 RepID=A0AAV5EZQ2_ELECO|nr:hypothetical protein QOZ80_9BG0698690 [Eleusine coracana subsp. coracana]GJN28292.1 hypothetical protein PR202_gb16400 [Eleusine coracana subsp. coracana]
MGNCLVIQDSGKEVKIMSVDNSKVLKESSADEWSQPRKSNGVFSLLPVKAPAAAVADPGPVRVKLVVSKQELKKMLEKEGMSLDDMVSLMRKEAGYCERDEQQCCGGWRPVLESIPEGSYL